ncbi:MAG: PepSY-associated TM helix domain-containing protein [Methylocystis sp.]
MRKVRSVFVFIHRWVGLAMTAFLILVGLTGSMLAFYDELERLVTPQLFATARPGEPRLDLAALAERTHSLVPQASGWSVVRFRADQAEAGHFVPRNDLNIPQPSEFGAMRLYFDPWTGKELGRRINLNISEGWINLMPFIYVLHFTLASGSTGYWIMGLVALFWTVDCFIAFYLTLPVTTTRFWRRWKPSWLVKWLAGAYRVNFDLHRASGLWFWPVLFIFAWSSVMFNMGSVYTPVTQLLFDYVPYASPPQLPEPREHPRLDWRAAQDVGARLMVEQAAARGFSVTGEPTCLAYEPDTGLYLYCAPNSLDVSPYEARTALWLDGDTGALARFDAPTGEHSGNTVTAWLRALHMGHVFGLPYRMFVCVLGLIISMLSVTGIYIWWKKRKARVHRRAAMSQEAPASLS